MIESPPSVQVDEKAMGLYMKERALIDTINDDYLYWDKVKYKAQSIGVAPEVLWSSVKIVRVLIHRTLQFNNYGFNFSITNYITEALNYFDMNAGGIMASNTVMPEREKQKFLISSIMEEAISSSQMEGASTTRQRAKEILRKEIKPKSKSDMMIVNNYVTIKHIAENRSQNLSPENLLHIHRLISSGTLENEADEGKFREADDVYVINYQNSEIVHTPPPASEIPGLVAELCHFFNNDSTPFIHPIIKAITIHFLIGWIHPFVDGNGRTARALFYWYMLKKGYWLTEYISVSRIIQGTKVQYEKAYLHTERDDNDLSYFITYNLQAMRKAFEALSIYIARKQRERMVAADFLRIPNINERQAELLGLFLDTPETVLTVKEAENRLRVSNVTARQDLKSLLDLGLIDAIAENKVKIKYIRSARFNEILRGFGIGRQGN
ncbi:MAG: Fic family protein [Bacteroidota bacterium]